MKNKITKTLALLLLALTIVTNGMHMAGAESLWQGGACYVLSEEEDQPIDDDHYLYP